MRHKLALAALATLLALALTQAAMAQQGSLYLVDNATVKALRVPYLAQDHVGECWLYAGGMVAMYYGKSFDPSQVLKALGKGYNVSGASLDVLKYYGIPYECTHDAKRLADYVKKSIDEGKPVLLSVKMKLGTVKASKQYHAVVVTGYRVSGGRVDAVIVNDPSGALVVDGLEMQSPRRIDGSTVDAYSDPAYYQVVIPLRLLENTSRVEVVEMCRPRQPPAQAPPEATLSIYTPTEEPVMLVHVWTSEGPDTATSFYVINNEPMGVWTPVPAASKTSRIIIPLMAVPNTRSLLGSSVTIEVTATIIYIDGSIRDFILYSFSGKIRDLGGAYTKVNVKLTDMLEKLENAEKIIIHARLRDAKGSIIAEAAPIEIPVYDALFRAEESLGDIGRLAVTAGLRERGDMVNVTLYLDARGLRTPVDVRLESPVKAQWRFSSPDEPGPSPTRGGYYPTLSFIAEKKQGSVHVSGYAAFPLLYLLELKKTVFNITIDLSMLNKLAAVNIERIIHDTRSGLVAVETSYHVDSYILYILAEDKVNMVTRILGCGATATEPIHVPTGVIVENLSIAGCNSLETIYIDTVLNIPGLQNPEYCTGAGDCAQYVNPTLIDIKVGRSMVNTTPGSIIEIPYTLTINGLRNTASLEIALHSVTRFEATLYPVSGGEPTRLSAVTTYSIKDVSAAGAYSLSASGRIYVKLPRGIQPGRYVLMLTPVQSYGGVYAYGRYDVYLPGSTVNITLNVAGKTGGRGLRNLAIALVIDTSGSMGDVFRGREKIDWAKEAASILVRLLIDGDVVTVVEFSDSPYVVQPPIEVNSTVKNLVEQRIAALSAGGATDIGDSLLMAADLLEGLPPGYVKVIILLTDGVHNTGTHPLTALQRIRGKGIKIYTIGLGDPGDVNETVLRIIAEETGGAYYHAPTPDQLADIYRSLRYTAASEAQPLVDYVAGTLSSGERTRLSYTLNILENPYIIDVVSGPGLALAVNVSGYIVNATPGSYLLPIGVNATVKQLAADTLRIILAPAETMNATGQATAAADHPLSVEILLENRASTNTSFEISILGGELVPFTAWIEGSTRLTPGSKVAVKAAAPGGAAIHAAILGPMGRVVDATILYDDGLHGDGAPGDQVYAGTMTAPQLPGRYKVKVVMVLPTGETRTKLLDIEVVSGGSTIPVAALEGLPPTYTVLGEANITAKLRVYKPAPFLIIETRLNAPPGTAPPRLAVTPALITSPGNHTLVIRVDAPPGTTPGTYPVTIAIYTPTEGIVYAANTTIRVPRATVIPVNTTITLIAPQTRANAKLALHVEADVPVNVTVTATGNITIDGAMSKSYTVTGTRDITAWIAPTTSKPGISTGVLSIAANNTPLYTIPTVIVTTPPEADTTKTTWIIKPNKATITVEGAQLALQSPATAAGYIAPTRGGNGYIAYIAPGTTATLTIQPARLTNIQTITIENIETGDTIEAARTPEWTTIGYTASLQPGLYLITLQEKPPCTNTTITITTTKTTIMTETATTTALKTITIPVPGPQREITKTTTTTRTIQTGAPTQYCAAALAIITAATTAAILLATRRR